MNGKTSGADEQKSDAVFVTQNLASGSASQVGLRCGNTGSNACRRKFRSSPIDNRATVDAIAAPSGSVQPSATQRAAGARVAGGGMECLGEVVSISCEQPAVTVSALPQNAAAPATPMDDGEGELRRFLCKDNVINFPPLLPGSLSAIADSAGRHQPKPTIWKGVAIDASAKTCDADLQEACQRSFAGTAERTSCNHGRVTSDVHAYPRLSSFIAKNFLSPLPDWTKNSFATAQPAKLPNPAPATVAERAFQRRADHRDRKLRDERCLPLVREALVARGFNQAALLAVQICTNSIEWAQQTLVLAFHQAIEDALAKFDNHNDFDSVWSSLQTNPTSKSAIKTGSATAECLAKSMQSATSHNIGYI